MATPAHVQVAVDGSGKKIDPAEVVSTEPGTPTVERQVTVLGDPNTYANQQAVNAAGEASIALGGGLVTQNGQTTPHKGVLMFGRHAVGVPSLPADSADYAMSIGDRQELMTGSIDRVLVEHALPTPARLEVPGAVATAAAQTYTEGMVDPLSMDLSGNVRVNGSGVTQPVSIAATVGTNSTDGGHATIGATTDPATASTLVGLLKSIRGGALAATSRLYWARTGVPGANLVANTAKTVLGLATPAAKTNVLKQVDVSFNGTNGAALPCLVEVIRCSADGTGTPFTPLPTGQVQDGTASDTTCQTIYTVEPTVTAILASYYVSVVSGVTFNLPLGEEGFAMIASQFLAIRLTSPTAVKYNVNLLFKENR